ncbi:MAG: hypothetical protein MUF60_00825 [Vicinamibacterales bacterium]|jgi:hypothetical protein|nr:hypothetical protein [Vicinamibacterales bacterium]
MAGYKSDTSNAWAALQVYPNSRLEIFANTALNTGTASITDFGYDAGSLTGVLFGLDFPLHSASMSGFSNLRLNRLSQTVGFNYRLTGNLVLNTMFVYEDYDDKEPWLYDATGSYTNFYAGVSWIF